MTGPFSIAQEQRDERVVLDRIKVSVNSYVSRHAVLDTYYQDTLVDTLVMSLRSEVLAQKLSSDTAHKTVVFQHDEPASAWQMFKRNHADSWWLGWLVERHPVRFTPITKSETVTFTAETMAAYPDAAINLPRETFGSPFIFSRVVAQ